MLNTNKTPGAGGRPGERQDADSLCHIVTGMSTRDAALGYASQGIPVFPCNRDKSPKTKHGFHDATTVTEQIKKWWNIWPNASIGMPTGPKSATWVLDADLYKEGARDAFDKLIQANGPLPGTRTQKTGGGGWHYFFKHPGGKIPSRSNHLGPGIDIKGNGGYVILPPSGHPSGGHYKWIDERPAVEAPTWLIDLVKEKSAHKKPEPRHGTGTGTPYGLKALESETANIHQAVDGKRNETLNKAAFSLGQLVAGGELSRTLAENTLFDAGITAGLSESETLKTIQSGLTSGEQSPRQAPQSNQASCVTCTENIKPGNPDVIEDWPEPPPIPKTLKPVEPFTFELIPRLLRPWVADIANRMQCPPDYPGVSAMVVLSSLIGRKIGIHPKQHDDWLVIPNLWGLLVGRPSELKSPALKESTRLLRRLEVEAKKIFEEDQSIYEVAKIRQKLMAEAGEKEARAAIKAGQSAQSIDSILKTSSGEAELPPARKRYIVNDATVEKLGEILNENPDGVLLFRDEISGWLRTINREDRTNDRAFYLEAWDGAGRYVYDRIGRGTVDIEAVCVSILGGIQPGKLISILRGAISGGHDDDGFVQRFQVAVYPDRKPWAVVDRWPDVDAKNQAFQLIQTISELPSPCDEDTIPGLRFDQEAQTMFYEWLQDLETEIRGDDIHPAMESHLAKYRSLIPSMALICHIGECQQIDLSKPVGSDSLVMALGWYEYLRSHAERIYSLAINNDNQGATTILNKFQKGKLENPFKKAEIQRAGWTGLSTSEDIDGALNLLLDLGYIRSAISKTGQAGGRPAISYIVNPKICSEGA